MRNALGFSCGFVSPWIAAAIGIAAGVIVGAFAERYTSAEYRPTQFLAKASLEGPALTITQGMALGMKSCMAPCIVLAAGIIVSYKVSGMYGVAMAAKMCIRDRALLAYSTRPFSPKASRNAWV